MVSHHQIVADGVGDRATGGDRDRRRQHAADSAVPQPTRVNCALGIVSPATPCGIMYRLIVTGIAGPSSTAMVTLLIVALSLMPCSLK